MYHCNLLQQEATFSTINSVHRQNSEASSLDHVIVALMPSPDVGDCPSKITKSEYLYINLERES
uniref:Uncharacterized protein n=1 Tax=Arundo donax TaxID=35708 RepID=A0A0A8Z8Q9_ARUDO